MTVEELLQTPLMRGAKLLAGESGLDNEVTWCAIDSGINFDNWVMPGMLLMLTGVLDEVPPEEAERRVKSVQPSAILCFNDFNEEWVESSSDWCNKLDFPFIQMPRGTNTLAFSKHFVAAYTTQLSRERRRDEWLRDLCAVGPNEFDMDDTVAETYGYSYDHDYYCIRAYSREKSSDPIAVEMDSKAVLAHIDKAFTHEGMRPLSYMDAGRVTAFAPWGRGGDLRDLREEATREARALEAVSSSKWTLVVGSSAASPAEFYRSRKDAIRTRRVTEMLEVHDRAVFYDDWYMHMLLLKEPRPELESHMRHSLGPILGSPDLLETLINYLVFGENLKVTAEKTFIHINTLKYRLKRIQELLGVDLHDPNVRFRLRMAVTIERYLRE